MAWLIGLAKFAAELNYDELPPEVAEQIKLCIIDQIGVQMALSTLPIALEARTCAALQPDGRATVVGSTVRTSAEMAALANGVSGHAFELDDIHWEAFNHPGAAVIPAALAVGEATGAPGRALIEAVAAGYEVMLRVGVALRRERANSQVYCPVGETGAIGAAVAAARLWGLSSERVRQALELAATQVLLDHRAAPQGNPDIPNVLRWLGIRYGPHTVSCDNGGVAARAGVQSAFLARAGFRAPASPQVGVHALARRLSDGFDPEPLLDRLGSHYALLRTGFKLRPYPGAVHAVVDQALEALAALRFRTGEDISSGISKVRVGQRISQLRSIWLLQQDPSDGTSDSRVAPHSLRATVAHALLYGGTLESVLAFDPHEPAVRRLAAKVSPEFDADCEAASPRALARVRVEAHDGRAAEAVGYQKGCADDPLTTLELHTKFADLAGRVLPQATTERLLDALKSLDEVRDIRDLRPLLSAERE